MARIAVTGGSGKLGRAVVKDLLDHGNDVVNLDLTPGNDPRARWTKTDLSDFGQAVGVLTAVDDRYDKIDAVVHLAAIPAPGLLPNAATFHNNITVTYNVFAAARTAGIKTIVWASSETVLGLPFDTTPPPYLPADEEYPARPNSSYSLAKHLEEQMAAQFCRWDPTLTMVGLRFSNVMDPDDYKTFPSYDADPHSRSWNAWGYIDARDGAQAVRRALAYGEPGVEVFVIANADTVMSRSSAALAAEVFPGLPVKKELGEHETLLSIDKARRLLGYEPEFTWRS
ncbi:NAD-dependent epimerase/dehydratase family protein [Paractinoplanes brasiliensis]|uniref:Nucleoside-diphosphate-sugar epimerase n=1 Tax=Paractinoplanes brasiliensis TaxID=52695 RepID=A0A4V3C8E4_9ACTN|nr:NAD(P)-dependent oxidoreductase [Actinoplanes brasiliensis]TDO41308.1 nucleoside-diphosphate-sugar epimerase [Actinoplanes brasiliensis]GID27410.1 UDP-glucose 4-epimerase [Actinoplanes brasiliensis]